MLIKTKMICFLILVIGILISSNVPAELQKSKNAKVTGAWEAEIDNQRHVWIITEDDFIAMAVYHKDNGEFFATSGGKLVKEGLEIEFHSEAPDAVGNIMDFKIVDVTSKSMKVTMDGVTAEFKNIDKGKPGKLAGAWLFSQRKTDEGLTPPRTPGTRKTMKILSGTRFQWIAYDTKDGAFSGTGGGTYTTKDGKYTENIEFFSRDNSRVGASLDFDYKIEAGGWHHSGLNSKGEPLYEVWRLRKDLED